MAPVQRGWAGTLLDRVFTWLWGLPLELCTYTVDSVCIPFGDGAVQVDATLYQPRDTMVKGTVLVRTPYGIGTGMALGNARIYAARGYQVLMASCANVSLLGKGPSMDQEDVVEAHAVVSWMREQPWYTGSFATLGGSYTGFTQWSLLSKPPTDMRAAIIGVGPHDFSRFIWGSGALNSDIIGWMSTMLYVQNGGRIPPPIYFRLQRNRLVRVMQAVPLLGAINTFLGRDVSPRLQYMVTHPDLTDPFWKTMQNGDALDHAESPILLISGWYDFFLQQTMKQYSRLAERGCDVALTVGPWGHLEAQGGPGKVETLSWLDEHLAQSTKDGRNRAVRMFVTGVQEWREFARWPPATQSHALYLWSGNKLSENRAPDHAPDSSFTFDPSKPTPTIGSSTLLHMSGGKEDDAALSKRPDVVSFTTEPLVQNLDTYGKPYVELHHSTSHPHADLLVRLSEVDPSGRSHNVAETYLRLDVNRGQEPLHLDLLDCAHRFRKRFRIRLIIAGGSHPKYIRNLGMGDDSGMATTFHPVLHTIHHNSSAVSRLVLPVTTPS